MGLGMEEISPTVTCVVIDDGKPIGFTTHGAGERTNEIHVDFLKRGCAVLVCGWMWLGMAFPFDTGLTCGMKWKRRGTVSRGQTSDGLVLDKATDVVLTRVT